MNNLFNNIQKEEPKIPTNKNINFNNIFNKKYKNKSYVFDYSQHQNTRVAAKAIRLNQIILLILTPVKKMVKNDCVFFSFEPKFKYNLKY